MRCRSADTATLALRRCVLVVCLLPCGFIRAEAPNIIADGVPEPSSELRASVAPYLEYRTASFQGWHPQRRSALIITRFGNTPQLHEVAAPGLARTQISFEAEPIAAGGYDPTRGDVLLASQDVGGQEHYQLFRFVNGSKTLLTDGASRNTDVVFNKDGTLIGFTSTRRNGKDADLWVMSPRDPSSARLARESKGPGWRFLDFAPDGTYAVVQQYMSSTDGALYRLDLRSGDAQRITRTDRGDIGVGGARFAPDGSLYATTDEESDTMRLVRLDPTGGSIQPLLPASRWNVEAFDVAADGSYIVYVINEAGSSRLKFFDLRTRRIRDVRHLPDGVMTNLHAAPWGEVGFTLSAARSPADVYSVHSQTLEARRWTFSEVGGLDASTFVEPELFSVRSFDGVEISGFLYRPDARRFSGRRPLIMVIHGGPVAQSRPGFLGRENYFLNELGIAQFYPNVRGSEGYGKRFVQLDDGYHREDALKDVGAFLEALARDPRLDANRFALSGGSYGGYLVLGGMIDYRERVRAGLVQSGISSFISFLTNTADYRRDLRRVEYGDERDPVMRAFLERISPLGRAARIEDPLMVVSGANDPRVPLSESEQIVAAVRARGGEAWHVIARDEGHGYRKKANRDYQFLASVSFWRKVFGLSASQTH